MPEDWLNPNAGMWMPPLPGGVLDQPAEPGLRVTYADDGFLLATKLVAQRAKDADDVVALAGRLGLSTATPEQLETHIRSYYTDPAPLELIVDGPDVDREISLLAHDACRMLTAPGARPPAMSTPLNRARTPEPNGFGAALRARNALPGPHLTPRASDPPGSADHSSCLERGVRGRPSNPHSHARSPVRFARQSDPALGQGRDSAPAALQPLARIGQPLPREVRRLVVRRLVVSRGCCRSGSRRRRIRGGRFLASEQPNVEELVELLA